jgi:hypothetical protein
MAAAESSPIRRDRPLRADLDRQPRLAAKGAENDHTIEDKDPDQTYRATDCNQRGGRKAQA